MEKKEKPKFVRLDDKGNVIKGRAKKYEEKVAVDISFEDLLKLSVTDTEDKPEKEDPSKLN